MRESELKSGKLIDTRHKMGGVEMKFLVSALDEPRHFLEVSMCVTVALMG